jgi:hypothetical protein
LENYAEIASVQGLFRKRHAHKQHCKALVKSLKPKLKKALEAINKITTVQFDTATEESKRTKCSMPMLLMLPSLQISFLSQHRMPPAHQHKQLCTARLEQQTIGFFKIHSPQVNFKDATKTPANKSATFPTIVLYCPT